MIWRENESWESHYDNVKNILVRIMSAKPIRSQESPDWLSAVHHIGSHGSRQEGFGEVREAMHFGPLAKGMPFGGIPARIASVPQSLRALRA